MMLFRNFSNCFSAVLAAGLFCLNPPGTLAARESVAEKAPAGAVHPNIVIVMTDDQGYPELSAHGNPVLQTPHLDNLHSRSLRLTDFHVAPMCAPTRGQLLTGLDAVINGCINVSSGRALLRAEIPTMGNLFGEAGYRCGIFGKWHLGANYPYRPQDRGFDRSVWFPSSHIGSVPDAWGNDYFDDIYITDGKPMQYKGYCADVFFSEAMKFMKAAAKNGRPFLSYIATNTPHGPLIAPEADRRALEKTLSLPRFASLAPGLRKRLAQYLGMVRNVDTNMGRLGDFLQAEGLMENTILVFLTDNGSTHGPRYYNAGMRGQKTELWEGGHRVPCLISWPGGKLARPGDVDGLTQVQDLLPTLLELSGVPAPSGPAAGHRFSGISLAGALRGQTAVSADRTLIINYSRMPNFVNYPTPFAQSIMKRNQAAVLWKRWRLLEDRELYNLDQDPLQQKNVIGEHPDVVRRMRGELDRWWKNVGPRANEPQRIVIGSDRENPTRLTGCEWLDVFIDQQRQVRRGEQKSGYWLLQVARAGEYEFELRRWPRDAGYPISGADPQGAGKALPITSAAFYLSDHHHLPIGQKRPYGFEGLTQPVKPGDVSVTFSAKLKPGPVALHTWFRGPDTILSAYYVIVRRKPTSPQSDPPAVEK